MPRLRLSRTAVDRLSYPGKQTIFWDTKLTGFGVRVNEHSRTWVVAYRIGDQERRLSLGRCDRVDIDTAYQRAEQIIRDAAEGISPEDRQRERAPRATTLQEVFSLYCATRKSLKKSSIELYDEELDRYLSDWLPLPIRNITGDMVVTRHAAIGSHAPSRADAVMRVLRALCNFAIEMYDGEVLSLNPVRKLSKLAAWYKPRRRDSYLSPGELGPWVRAVLQLASDGPRDALLVMLFTGARLGEVTTLQWQDINLQEKTAIFRETKTGKPLLIPLCSYLSELLKIRSERAGKPETGHVFPSYGKDGHTKDLRASLRAVAANGAKQIMPHDLRRTFLSICNALDIGPYTQKRLVGHAVPQDVTEGYVQHSIERLRSAVESVADYIQQAVSFNQERQGDTGNTKTADFSQ